MEAQLKEAGYEVDLQYASNDIATQVSQIENMINSGCQLLVIASIDGDSLGTVLDQAKEKKHMTASQAATIARDSNSKRMCMIHYSPRYTDKELEKLLSQAQKIYPNAELSRDRMHIEIPYED